MIAAHSEEFASRGKKYQTSLTFSSRPREANFSPKICRTREEMAELTASRGAAGLTRLPYARPFALGEYQKTIG